MQKSTFLQLQEICVYSRKSVHICIIFHIAYLYIFFVNSVGFSQPPNKLDKSYVLRNIFSMTFSNNSESEKNKLNLHCS